MSCNPCHFCLYGREFFDVGEWFNECELFGRPKVHSVKPCPYFRPKIVSNQLIEQLEWERYDRQYTEETVNRMAKEYE